MLNKALNLDALDPNVNYRDMLARIDHLDTHLAELLS